MEIKIHYYGELSESLVISLKNLAATQVSANKVEEGRGTLIRAIETAKNVIAADKVKDMKIFRQHITEVIFLLHSLGEKDFTMQVSAEDTKEHEELLNKCSGGEKNP